MDFTCAHCKQTYPRESKLEDMLMEMMDNFGEAPVDDELLELCDPCYKMIMAWYRAQL